MDDQTLRAAIDALHTRYIRAIDDDKLEDWPELFTETCLYKIVTRENYDQGLPLGVIECRSRGMMQDRVTGLRRINVYEPQRYLHQISGLIIERLDDRSRRCRSNYLVIRTMADGTMSIFSAGMYVDKIVFDDDGAARFEERLVIQDSRRVDTLLVIPL